MLRTSTATTAAKILQPAGYARGRMSSSSIRALQNAFRDPSSPYYLAPGTQGPSEEAMGFPTALATSPSEVAKGSQTDAELAAKAKKWAVEHGCDPLSFWEQKVVWGDLDSFQHVNNARYLGFIEASRMQYFLELAKMLNDQQRAVDMLQGRGKSLILKSISVNFKRPVTYPDTLLVALKPHNLQSTRFDLGAKIYSYAQQKEVASSDSVCVWYDYDALAKCEVPSDLDVIVKSRVQ